MYGEFAGKRVDATKSKSLTFKNWISWAKSSGLGLDFNPHMFFAPEAADGFTLSHSNRVSVSSGSSTAAAPAKSARDGRAIGTPCVNQVWVPDGFKDTPADRQAPRERLAAALDESLQETAPRETQPRRRSKENSSALARRVATVGSHEFYLGYAITRRKLLCLDAGHFHPPRLSPIKSPACCSTSGNSAARQPWRALGQRPRRHLHRRSPGHRRESSPMATPTASTSALTISTLASTASAAWVIGRAQPCSAPCCSRCLEPPGTAPPNSRRPHHRLALRKRASRSPCAPCGIYYCETMAARRRCLAGGVKALKKFLSKRS